MNKRDKALWEVAKIYTEQVDKSLTGTDLVTALTSTCLKSWYDLTNKFAVKATKFDIAPDQKDQNDYMTFKMSMGDDSKDIAVKSVQDANEKLTNELNRIFGRQVFVSKISKDGDMFETLVAYQDAKGGVFQCKAQVVDGHTTFVLLMPDEDNLERTFSSMANIPHPNDIGDDFGTEPVASDPTQDFDPEYNTFEDADFDQEFDDDPLTEFDDDPEDFVESLIKKFNSRL